MRRGLSLILLTVIIVNLGVASVLAAGGEKGPRRIDTANVVNSTDIKDIEKKEPGAAEKGHATEKKGEKAEEHHPAWMVPGWQAGFALLAVGYFAFAVTVLPRFVAKEEH
jgi:hypothetical protein